MDKFVTISGECFEAQFDRRETGQDSNGVYYTYALKDLTKGRGECQVAIFRSAKDELLVPSDNAKFKMLLGNFVRQAFDAGQLNFEEPNEPTKFQHLSLKPGDFSSRPGASDPDIRRLILNEAYWLGYKYSPTRYPIQFDSPADRRVSTTVRHISWEFIEFCFLSLAVC